MSAKCLCDVHAALESWQEQDMRSYCKLVAVPLLICASFAMAPIYSFSIFILDIQQIFSDGSATSGHAVYSASTCIAILSLSGAFLGSRVASHPRQVCFAGSFLASLGLALTGFAVQEQILWLLYLGLGLIGGIGMGCCYYTTISMTILSFKAIGKAGLGSGLAGLTIGLWSAAYSYAGGALNSRVGTPCTFYITSALLFLLLLPPSFLFQAPSSSTPQVTKNIEPQNTDLEMPADSQETESTDSQERESTDDSEPEPGSLENSSMALPSMIKRRALVRQLPFQLLCLGYFFFLTPGFGVKLLIGPQLHEVYHASQVLQDTASGMFLFAYGTARFVTGICSDRFPVMIMYQVIGMVYFASALLSGFCVHSHWPAEVFIVLTSLQGVGLACMKVLLPVIVVQMWGAANSSTVFGMVSLGSTPAIVLGPVTSWLALSQASKDLGASVFAATVASWFWSCSAAIAAGVACISFVRPK